MSLEAVKKVTETVKISKERMALAAQEAKKLNADAEKAGKRALADARRAAEARVREQMAQAEQDAAVQAGLVREQAQKDCLALKTEAQAKLDAAAALIVRRVVDA